MHAKYIFTLFVFKAEEEVSKYRDSTKQLLKDMEAQQKLKASVEEDNRTLQGQIMQAERQLHQHMQVGCTIDYAGRETATPAYAGWLLLNWLRVIICSQ